MQKKHFIFGIALMAGCTAIVLVARVLSHSTPPAPSEEVSANSGNSAQGALAGRTVDAEILRLRAELQRRDLALRTMALAREESNTGQSPPIAEDPSAQDHDPMTIACDALDERMLTAPVDARKSAELNQAISGMLGVSAVPDKSVVSTHCGSTLCKVVLHDATPSELELALRKVSENTPKVFGGVVVYNSNSDEKSLYFARDGKDLSLTPVEEGGKIQRVVVHQQDSTTAFARQTAAETTK